MKSPAQLPRSFAQAEFSVDQGKGYDWSVITIQGPIQQRLTFAAPRLLQPHENDSDSLASRAASHRKDPKFEGGWVGDSIASTVTQLSTFAGQCLSERH